MAMLFRQYYLDCLSHSSYMIGDTSTGRAVVVDPQRDVARYLAEAARHHLLIERVIETHFHADFLSGHLELAAHTGAVITYGAPADTNFPIDTVHDGDRFVLGEVALEIRATPGHTPESISIVVFEHPDDITPFGVLTGDTLFVGDVGRPDLLTSTGVPPELMARQLYHSLRDILLSLPDETRVYPAHGAGSPCGKNISTELTTTIGEQRRHNDALAPMSADEFVAMLCEGQLHSPPYFPRIAQLNHEQHELLVEHELPPELGFAAVRALLESGAVLLDTRAPTDYAERHLRGSLNVGLQGRFAEFAGHVVPPDSGIILICDRGRELEARIRLARIGFDHILGYLHNPARTFAENPEHTARSRRITAAGLAQQLAERADTIVIDIRNPTEHIGGTIDGAICIPLARFLDHLDLIDHHRPVVIYCATGHRSSIATSALTAAGHTDVADLLGGFAGCAECHERRAIHTRLTGEAVGQDP